MTVDLSAIQPGDELHASCSDEVYGIVTAVHPENGGLSLKDVRLYDLIEIDWQAMHGENVDDRSNDLPNDFIEVGDQRVTLGNVRVEKCDTDYDFHNHAGYRGVAYVVLDTPGHGCYRCVKLFLVRRKTSVAERWGVWNDSLSCWASDDDGHFGTWAPQLFDSLEEAMQIIGGRPHLTARVKI